MILGMYGAGGAGRSFMNAQLNDRNIEKEWDDKVYIDDVIGVSELDGRKVYTFDQIKQIYSPDEIRIIISLGEPTARKAVYDRIKADGYKLHTYIDVSARIWDNVQIGEGCIVFPETVVDNNTVLKENSIIYLNAMVGHDTVVGAHSVVSVKSFIAGHCNIGACSYIGPGALLKDRLQIGEEGVIGLGAAVYRDVPAGYVAIGNPARAIQRGSDKGVF